jgi:hypothetical protein
MTAPIDAAACLGTHDVLFLTIDTLRFDVAAAACASGETPNLRRLMPGGHWEKRHTPCTFTYGAHQAFFAGFLPTPTAPRERDSAAHTRLFAAKFPGSETTGSATLVFDAPDIVTGFAAAGYHTLCIGGTGFFNKRSPLGAVLPGLFAESVWHEDFGVACADSAENQARFAADRIGAVRMNQRVFCFVNFSACHPPYPAQPDGQLAQRAALATIDRALPTLLDAARGRGVPVLTIICSDHGTSFGDDGYHGHRLAHPSVWDVPYMQTVLS